MSLCIHLVDLVDDCQECREFVMLKHRVEELQKIADSLSRELSVKNYLLLKSSKILTEVANDRKEYAGIPEMLADIKEYVR